MELTSDRSSLLPTEDDVAFYEEHGWWVSPPMFSDDEMDEALRAVERHYAGERDCEPPGPLAGYLDWSPDKGADGLRMNNYIALQQLGLRALALSPVLGETAARLARTPEIRLFNSTLIYKPPHVEGDKVKIGWHVDRAYWQTSTSRNMLTAWIAFHDCDEEMGTITMLDGSHRWPADPVVDELRSGRTFVCEDVDALERRLEALGLPLVRVPVNVRRGQVSFHHCLTFHGSGVNRRDRPRISMTVHMQDESNRYQPAFDHTGAPFTYRNDAVCRKTDAGEPDYRDPAICPVIWRTPEPSPVG
jgi:hypothetical protein